MSRIGKSKETESRLVVPGARGREIGVVPTKEHRVSFGGDELF